MRHVRASDLAAALGITKGRVSQLVAEGRLDGCFTGEGRDRRFDLERAAQALDRRLDPSQTLGNGAAAFAARRAVLGEGPEPAPEPTPRADDPLTRLAAARAENAELDARRKRREEMLAAGRYVLADEVARAQAAAVARALDALERHHLEAVRRLAEAAGHDIRTALAEARDAWRDQRRRLSADFAAAADAATHTEAERAELAAAPA